MRQHLGAWPTLIRSVNITNHTCIEANCERPVQARQLCASHYSVWHRAQKKHTITCAHCGEVKNVGRPRMQYCNALCKQRGLLEIARGSDAMALHNAARAANTKPPRESMSPEELEAYWKAQRSPIRAAYEDQDWPGVIAAIKSRSSVTDDGCWEWLGQSKQGKKSGGRYASITWGKGKTRTFQVYRLALEAKHGKPLGKQAAHHTCANTICVNPEHLQPVTHAQNAAEMLARRYYESRIADLEAALQETQPDHPLLGEVGIPVALAA